MADVKRFYEARTPGIDKTVSLLFDDPAEWEKQVRVTQTELGLLPTDPAEAQQYLKQYSEMWGQFLGTVFRGEPIRDRQFLEQFFGSPRFHAADRNMAGLLLYLDTGEVSYMVRSLLMAPQRVAIYTAVKDDQFAVILKAILAGAAAEEVELIGSGRTQDRPYSRMVNLTYPELAAAIYFQGADPDLAQHLFSRVGYFRVGLGFRAIRAIDVVTALQGVGEAAPLTFVRSLVDQGLLEDLASIEAAFPNLRASLIVPAIRDRIEVLRRELRTQEEFIDTAATRASGSGG